MGLSKEGVGDGAGIQLELRSCFLFTGSYLTINENLSETVSL